ncbi:MAG: hypothetical protein FVQ82_16160 [Planctomycetes bacterium]|nr:hypothetical protein [Planctomycetota bacterium]
MKYFDSSMGRFILSVFAVISSGNVLAAGEAAVSEKKLYLPEKIWMVAEGNDYDKEESDYCYKRMVEGANVAIFWHKEYGDDPMANKNENKRFDVNFMLKEGERAYDCFVNDLKLVEKGKSISDKYKLLVFVYGGDGGSAYGGGAANEVGVFWTPATRVNKTPYGVLGHEMGHSFQFLSRIDSGIGANGSINEMSAQYVLWQVYPEWMTFENYHLIAFMKKTHYAFLHKTNMYHSPYVLEYWASKHGADFYGKLNRETKKGEDPVMTYKRLNELSQEQFNDEMFDACRRFITWDLKRVEKVAKPYANKHKSKLKDVGDDWYRVPASNCPQNYGYNGVKLEVPAAGTEVVVEFKGVAGAEGYSAVKVDKAGWRYGFVASLKDGKRVYGDVCKDGQGKASFTVPGDTEYLWLVVMGAPTEHWETVLRWNDKKGENPDAQWPYKIKLTGTAIDESVTK